MLVPGYSLPQLCAGAGTVTCFLAQESRFLAHWPHCQTLVKKLRLTTQPPAQSQRGRNALRESVDNAEHQAVKQRSSVRGADLAALTRRRHHRTNPRPPVCCTLPTASPPTCVRVSDDPLEASLAVYHRLPHTFAGLRFYRAISVRSAIRQGTQSSDGFWMLLRSQGRAATRSSISSR